ncbi:MAG: FKBP-type peptidyl-prolyl cis-trans isomerase [Coriobacteriia bacterium]|nr:FKBP-type peptidyl-prolyl cis-trans isomerase [Coriobacteriia bacterium]MCL2537257.1 FKBP-type peptidyl-prolyl cis-trans isomerase [Coriobacteriia bacterium]
MKGIRYASVLSISLLLIFGLSFTLSGCDIAERLGLAPVVEELQPEPEPEPAEDSREYAPLDVLEIQDVIIGEGPAVVEGDTVSIDWTGFYMDGLMWNSSLRLGAPYTFVVGEGTVVEGWEQGVIGMQVGGERTLLVPSDLAFGAEGAHPMVAPHQDLRFDIILRQIGE